MPDLRDAGVAPETVARLVRDGTVVRVARGHYELADAIPDPRRSLAEVSVLADSPPEILDSQVRKAFSRPEPAKRRPGASPGASSGRIRGLHE